MTTLLIAEHDNASIKDATNKALTAAAALGGDVFGEDLREQLLQRLALFSGDIHAGEGHFLWLVGH